MKFEKKNLIGTILGVLILVVAFIFLRESKLFYFVIILALLIIVLPFFISFMLESGRQKEKEEKFLEFIRDLVENVRSGTPVSKSVINLKERDYGPLNEHVQKLANQVSLGIPLTKAFVNFARDSKSKVISRAVSLISEAEKAGGDVAGILESVANSVNQTEELKKERKAAIYNLVVQGYIIFIVFIIIMLVLQFKILPLLSEFGNVESDLSLRPRAVSPEQVSTPLFILILVQSFFAGLVIGKISEGSIKAGIKHSFILLALTLLITTGANALLG